jgi:DNA processing protein
VDVQDAVVLSMLTGLSRRRLGERLRRGSLTAHTSGRSGCAAIRFEHDRFDDVLRATARRPIASDTIETTYRAAKQALNQAVRRNITPLVLGYGQYPLALEAIFDPPVVLWFRGRPEVFDRPTVAIVGARAATVYARDVSARLGTDLAERGVTVVSGLARGVDVSAHNGALHSIADVCTVAVLGSGIDVMYPAEHAKIAEAIVGRGAIVSEFAPGTRPRPEHFPRRNRIISGLSQAIVVVEASDRSGALITADYALDQGRDVLAVPGNVLTGRNRGAHSLLRDGAKIVEDADDILEELGLPRIHARPCGPATANPAGSRDPVLRCMAPGEPYELDDLARESGLEAAILLPRLLELELAGHIRREGAQFVRSAFAR